MNEVIEAHYKDNYNKLCKIYRFRCNDETACEDVVQEAYVRAIKYFDNYDPTKDFAAWFYRIIGNAFNDWRRAERGVILEEFEEQHEEGIPCSSYNEKVIREINRLIDNKEEGQKEILSLYFRKGYGPTDIAAITSHTRVAVYKTIERFKKELKELYG